MAITSGFFNSIDGDRRYNADQMSTYFEGLVSDGVYENIGDRFIVTAGTGLTVNVGTGRALVKSHWIKNDATVSLTLDAADVQLPRIDAIVLRLDRTEGGRNINIVVVTGTPATSPTFNYSQSENVYDLVLATVWINKGTTQIVQGNITDRRSSKLCGWVTGIIKQVDTSDLFLQWQTAYENFYNDMTAQFDAYLTAKRTEFETWFNSLTSQLRVDTTIHKYQRTVQIIGTTDEIDVGISEYDSESDILLAFIGGIFFVENLDYRIDGTGSAAKIKLFKEIKDDNDVTFIVIKSVIGSGSGSSGGLTFVKLTQAEYDAITTPDPDTIYIIAG